MGADMDKGTPRITAVLGPTNTGKTHFAMERMLAHRSGVFGFPLRLLARENYDKAVALKGAQHVALITGEEKIVPAGARYFLCTVEAMPEEHEAEFLAVDEVQLAADPERGHVFTDRLLHARGTQETMFIGAATILPALKKLVPDAAIVTQPRFSKLTYAGPKKLTRLPPRSAVVGFSVTDVYALAEAVRRRRGGTAVVLGALSPRTRNAQVGLYQSGDVDYLVATDAIGMGLNMDVRHVAFAKTAKYDGRMTRTLRPAEIGQIAGRAGRHTRDGTFGTTAGEAPLEPDVIAAVESHSFKPIDSVFWRSREMDFASPEALLASLAEKPRALHLRAARAADDFIALAALANDPKVKERAASPELVRLLWDVCQIPDFRKVTADAHARILARVFADLSGEGCLSRDWVARQVERVDHTGGDIGTLMGRIADIRTWTYIAHHSDWLEDALHWQERTRDIEDRLSDALHERLTERFVDKRTAALVKGLRDKTDLVGAVRNNGEVLVEGVPVGHLLGLRFVEAESAEAEDARAIRNAVNRALAGGMAAQVTKLEADDDGTLALNDAGQITWRGAPVARLLKGRHILMPEVDVIAADFLDASLRARAAARVESWLARHIARRFGRIMPDSGQDLSPPARGLHYQLGEGLGSAPRGQLAQQVDALTKADRKALAGMGVRLGRLAVFVPALLSARSLRLRAILWAVWEGRPPAELPFAEIGAGPVWLDPLGEDWRGLAEACGYVWCGGGFAKPDKLEALGDMAFKLAQQGAFAPTPKLRGVMGVDDERLIRAMRALGFAWKRDEAGGRFSRKRGKARSAAPRRASPAAESPFAVLKEMTRK